jgi:hypothetical protein
MPDEHEQKVVDDIERCGWSLICIEDDPQGPSFVYSVGMMHTLDHPEVIMFGLDINLMGSIINGIGEWIRGGRRFEEPGLYDGLLEGFACKFVPVAEERQPEYFGYAMWHRRYLGKIGSLRAVQCIWPDMRGLFPDEAGCDPKAIALQPWLQFP